MASNQTNSKTVKLEVLTSAQSDLLDKALQFYMKQVLDQLPSDTRKPLADDWMAVWNTTGKLRPTTEAQ